MTNPTLRRWTFKLIGAPLARLALWYMRYLGWEPVSRMDYISHHNALLRLSLVRRSDKVLAHAVDCSRRAVEAPLLILGYDKEVADGRDVYRAARA